MIPTFDCYSDQSDPVQHLRQYHDKMVIHARNNSILCLIFPSSLEGLKGAAFNRFYSLPPCSIHKFGVLIKLFLTQYSSRQEFKQNNHHHFSIKLRPSDSLKAYIG